MTLKRISLYYLAGYLIPTGLALIAAPDVVFRLMQSTSNGAYGDVIPRLAGALVLALGIIVVNIIVRRIEGMLPALIGARAAIVLVVLWLYTRTDDPFFIAMAGVVVLGLVLTIAGVLRERAR